MRSWSSLVRFFVQSITREGDLLGLWIFRNAMKFRDGCSEAICDEKSQLCHRQAGARAALECSRAPETQPDWITPTLHNCTKYRLCCQHPSWTTWDIVKDYISK